ncbi:cysteine synthase CysM [Caballeronia sp. LZ029]|uniref:cysteine synthase CysM n=1 Tax=Caballeronia sp. LZ029 TaxID=3038564 RepID=UPI00045BA38D|nr:cysteine synthase CysM [Caballeronia sp. LZ029]KAK43007.1 cysteine synthase [Caballeronia jiangsuensis]MDR5748928.1 cysteine synthase CysM [Caballeronia sp. LZ029]
MIYPIITENIGKTTLVRLVRILDESVRERNNVILGKLEGHNPAGSVKDRAALSMITGAESRGQICRGDVLIEATSGNTGIALAMTAACRGYRMMLVMPEDVSLERRQSMRAYGAELILTPAQGGMEFARDAAKEMAREGRGVVLDQFSNPDNPLAHYQTTGPEIWTGTTGTVTHFVSAMGTTGTIMGVSRYLKERSADVQIVGVQPEDGARIPGIRRWPEQYLPAFFEAHRIDRTERVSQSDAEATARRLAAIEGVFCGISAGGACAVALRIAHEVENSTIAFIVCDRGDRYLSTGAFPA